MATLSLGTLGLSLDADFSKAERRIESFKKGLSSAFDSSGGANRLEAAVDKVGDRARAASTNVKNLGKSSKNASRDMKDAAGGAKAFSTNLGTVATLAGSLGLAKVFSSGVDAARSSIEAFSDYNESLNVIGETFGREAIPAVEEWAKATGDAVGRSQSQIVQSAGSFNALLQPLLQNSDAANRASKQFAQLAVDLGSFFNTSDEEALRALRSGLTGATEPLLKYGVNLKVAALEQFALSKGIKRSVSEMSEQEKVALRIEAIMAQTAQAQGDAARTADGYANSAKALNAQIENVSKELGEALLPAATSVVQALTKGLKVFLDLPSPIKNATFVLGGLVTALAALTSGLAAFVALGGKATFVALGVGIKAAGTAAVVATAPFAILAAKIGLAAGAGILLGKGIEALLIKMGKMRDLAKESSDAVQDLANNLPKVNKQAGKFSQQRFGNVEVLTEKEFKERLKKQKQAAREAEKMAKQKAAADRKRNKELFDAAKKRASIEANVAATQKRLSKERAEDAKPTKSRATVVRKFRADGKTPAQVKQEEQQKIQLQNQQALAIGLTTSALGDMGGAINAAAQGFSAGGPVGAAIAGFAAVASQTESFGEIQASANMAFQELVLALDPVVAVLAEAVIPQLKILADVLEGVGEALSTFKDAKDAIGGFGDAVEAAIFPVVGLNKGLAKVGNFLGLGGGGKKRTIESIVGKERAESIGQSDSQILERFLKNTLKFSEDQIKKITGDGEDLEGLSDAAQAQEEAAETQKKSADALLSATAQFTNVPEGFKGALRQFQATEAAGAPRAGANVQALNSDKTFSGRGVPINGAAAQPITNQTTLENVTIVSDNPELIWEKLKRVINSERSRTFGIEKNTGVVGF